MVNPRPTEVQQPGQHQADKKQQNPSSHPGLSDSKYIQSTPPYFFPCTHHWSKILESWLHQPIHKTLMVGRGKHIILDKKGNLSFRLGAYWGTKRTSQSYLTRGCSGIGKVLWPLTCPRTHAPIMWSGPLNWCWRCIVPSFFPSALR